MEKLTREQVIEKLNKDEKDFSRLDLSGLDLNRLDLSYSNLSYSNLSFANLYKANLSFANLYKANLSGANLYYANLENANLFNAELFKADLSNTRLDEKEQIRKGMILKEPMIGYKKCRDNIIVKLEIPKGAIVFSINNIQCRTNKAKVISISNEEKIAYSIYDDSFAYELGKEIEIEDFNLTYNVESVTGIHFYRTKKEAERCF